MKFSAFDQRSNRRETSGYLAELDICFCPYFKEIMSKKKYRLIFICTGEVLKTIKTLRASGKTNNGTEHKWFQIMFLSLPSLISRNFSQFAVTCWILLTSFDQRSKGNMWSCRIDNKGERVKFLLDNHEFSHVETAIIIEKVGQEFGDKTQDEDRRYIWAPVSLRFYSFQSQVAFDGRQYLHSHLLRQIKLVVL